MARAGLANASRNPMCYPYRRIMGGEAALPEPTPDQRVDRGLTKGAIIVLGYLLLALAIYVAAPFGIFDSGPGGRAATVLLGPFNILVTASGESNPYDSLAMFALISLFLLPAILASFGGSGCWPWFARFAVLGIWAVADFFMWLGSIPLE
jgi:hypothetical protein